MPMNRPALSRAALKKLHGRAGGECSFPECDARDNLVEAHIIGDKPMSARGRLPLPDGISMNSYENRIILCSNHHARIDSTETRDDYPPQTLIEMKRRHEEKVALSKKSQATTVSGQISASGTDADRVVGVRTSGHTRFEPGTQISADGTRAREVIGVEIGGDEP